VGLDSVFSGISLVPLSEPAATIAWYPLAISYATVAIQVKRRLDGIFRMPGSPTRDEFADAERPAQYTVQAGV